MTNDVINKVLYDVDQRADTTAAEKETARRNLGIDLNSLATVEELQSEATERGAAVNDLEENKQDKLTAGEGISITNNVVSADLTVKTVTSAMPPVETPVSDVKIFSDGRVKCDNSGVGLLVPEPGQYDIGKILVAYWSGSPGIGSARWETLQLPTVVGYFAGTGLSSSTDQSGNVTFSWAYSVGRNLHLNQNGAIQTNLPGGQWDAPAQWSNSFVVLSGADFAGAYRLACRHNQNDTYELALSYTASGTSSIINFIGTETVISLDNSVCTKQAAYIGEATYYTPSTRFGGNASTPFDPTTHKAIYYSGVAGIGPTSDTKIAIWQDNGAVKIAFTSIEVAKVGATN